MKAFLDCASPSYIGYRRISICVGVPVDRSNHRNYFTRIYHPYDHFMSRYTCDGDDAEHNG